MKNLQEFLIKKRQEYKLSLREASKIIGISHTYLNNLEKGYDPRNHIQTKPTPDTVMRISKAYDASYEYLMKLSDYLPEDTSLLSKEAERDVEKRFNILKRDLIESFEEFHISGVPLSTDTLEILLDSLSFGLRNAKIVNKHS